jgi:predicted type IV restriction endonuclease
LPPVRASEQQWLDQIKQDFLDLMEYPMHEEIVKMVVLAPLLMFAGLLRRPFLPVAERQVEIALADETEVIKGRIDVLVLHDQIWVAVIETKRKGFNVIEALPQALIYMTEGLALGQTRLGLITNGSEFRFVKLVQGNPSQYTLSDLLTLQKQDNDLYRVLQLLRWFGQQALAEQAA